MFEFNFVSVGYKEGNNMQILYEMPSILLLLIFYSTGWNWLKITRLSLTKQIGTFDNWILLNFLLVLTWDSNPGHLGRSSSFFHVSQHDNYFSYHLMPRQGIELTTVSLSGLYFGSFTGWATEARAFVANTLKENLFKIVSGFPEKSFSVFSRSPDFSRLKSKS